jgi:hypothetical protein
MATGGSFQGLKLEVVHSAPSNIEVKKNGAITFIPSYVFMA